MEDNIPRGSKRPRVVTSVEELNNLLAEEITKNNELSRKFEEAIIENKKLREDMAKLMEQFSYECSSEGSESEEEMHT